MFEVKINAKGQITIPKSLREKFGLKSGISLTVAEDAGKILIKPAAACGRCGKALPSLSSTCPDCPPPKIIKVY